MRRWLPGLALLLCLGAGQAGPVGLAAQLSDLVWRAYDRPEAALAELQLLRKSAEPAQLPTFQFAEARILIQAGDLVAAERLATQMAGQAEGGDRALLLRALIADREGQVEEAEAGAAKALAGFERLCQRDAAAASVVRGCDFRGAWLALRLLGREQVNQGASVLAEGSARFALSLAQAGGDPQMSVLSMSDLAVLAQAHEQPEPSRRWIEQAREAAQGDTMALARVKTYESVLARRAGDLPTALRFQQEGLELAQQAGAVHLVALMQTNLVDAHMHLGAAARALVIGRAALPVLLQFKDRGLERRLRHNLSVAHLKLGQLDAARREIARVGELRNGQNDTVQRLRELRELSEAWAEAGQPREALTVFHEERELTALANERNREASLAELKLKYDSASEQRDLDLLTRDKTLKDQELGNRDLARQVGIAVALLLGLSLLLAAVMVRKVRAANRALKANQALLRAQSERDPLTDLANRRHFLAVMEQQPLARFDGALLMVDIDHFKHVNDEHGHAIGDVVICEVARRLSHAVRAEDLVVRWGGEEFLVFAPDVEQEALAQLAERILLSVGSQPVETEDGPLRVTVSVGFAHFPLPPSRLSVHWEQAVNWADMALYTAKAQGRNRAMGIATVDARDTDALLQIEADFDAACSSSRVSLRQVLGPA